MDWADKRETRANQVFESNRPITSDWAFNTQPGHIPMRARIIAQEDRAFESLRKADDMRRRAAGIQAAADGAIYSDDPDAIEQLEAKIARLEAERKRITDYNKTARKGSPDLSILDERQRERLHSCARAGQVLRQPRIPWLRNLEPERHDSPGQAATRQAAHLPNPYRRSLSPDGVMSERASGFRVWRFFAIQDRGIASRVRCIAVFAGRFQDKSWWVSGT